MENQLLIGAKATHSKTIAESDVYGYSGITGDFNPYHVNEEYAKKTRFKHRIVPGPLLLSFCTTVLGMKIPGPQTILRSVEVNFIRPCYIGDTITATAEITEIVDNKITLRMTCVNQNNEMLVEGNAFTSVPRELLKHLLKLRYK